MTRVRTCLFGAIAVATLLFPSTAAAHFVYVDKETGSGTACDEANPCKTIQEGIDAADEFVMVDDSPTTYSETLTLGNDVSLFAQDFVGTFPEGPTIIDGGAGTAVTVTSAAGAIGGFTLRGAQGVVASAPVSIAENTFDDVGENGSGDVQVQASGSGVVVIGNVFTDASTGAPDTAVALSASSDATIVGNSFNGYDFAVEAARDGTSPTIQGNVISGSEADSAQASGVFIHDDASATVTANTVQTPAAGTRGIYVLENTTTAQGTGATLRRNRLLDHATAVQIGDTTGTVTLEGDLIANSSTTGLALDNNAVPATDGADVSATNVTFAANGTDIASADAHLTLDSSIVEDAVAATGTATCAITFSRGPSAGAECMGFQTTAAPGFLDPGAGNFHLAAGSAMIDAGNPAAPNLPIDLDGEARVLDGQCDGTAVRDIGADEFDANCPGPAPPEPEPEPEPGDTDPPDTAIDIGPRSKTKSRTATLSFHATDPGSSFECKLDGGSFEPCSAPKVYERLKKGAHGFEVRAIDATGNTDPTPASLTWKVKKRRNR